MVKILVGTPTYDGMVANTGALLISKENDRVPKSLTYIKMKTSLLTQSFNIIWATALNLKQDPGLTHLLMLHADVIPVGNDWIDTLLEEMEATQADVLSAIIPIKDDRGLTSTAIDTDPWCPTRITLHQAINEMPTSWTSKDVLLNTGLMLVDFRKNWVTDICFTIKDKLVIRPDGRWAAMVEPEDWNFSRQCHALGLKLVATRVVDVKHQGTKDYCSDMVWGQKGDVQNAKAEPLPQVVMVGE